MGTLSGELGGELGSSVPQSKHTHTIRGLTPQTPTQVQTLSPHKFNLSVNTHPHKFKVSVHTHPNKLTPGVALTPSLRRYIADLGSTISGVQVMQGSW